MLLLVLLILCTLPHIPLPLAGLVMRPRGRAADGLRWPRGPRDSGGGGCRGDRYCSFDGVKIRAVEVLDGGGHDRLPISSPPVPLQVALSFLAALTTPPPLLPAAAPSLPAVRFPVYPSPLSLSLSPALYAIFCSVFFPVTSPPVPLPIPLPIPLPVSVPIPLSVPVPVPVPLPLPVPIPLPLPLPIPLPLPLPVLGVVRQGALTVPLMEGRGTGSRMGGGGALPPLPLLAVTPTAAPSLALLLLFLPLPPSHMLSFIPSFPLLAASLLPSLPLYLLLPLLIFSLVPLPVLGVLG